jgi:hypothetical protein
MRRNAVLFALVPLLCLSQFSFATACGDEPAARPLPVRSSLVPPLADGLAGHPLGVAAPHVLLGESRDESLALDMVLRRLRLESCVKDEFANYKPRTQFDNTPWRFNMEKGKKFDAAQFDAWMKSRGVRVAKGAPAASGGTEPPATAVIETANTVSE